MMTFPKVDYAGITKSVPQLARGRVWCVKCGFTQPVNSGHALAGGWPLHCGQTMTIDSPQEREAMKRASSQSR